MRFVILLISVLFLSSAALAQHNYPLCSDQPITSRERIVFTTYYEDMDQQRDVYIFDPESGDICLLLANMRAIEFDWSPDGSSIVFNELKTNDIGHTYIEYALTIHVNGSQFRQYTELGVGVVGVTWSSDGLMVAYEQDFSNTIDSSEIFVREGFQGNVVAHYAAQGLSDYYPLGYPVWSPDNDRIAFPVAFLDIVLDDPILTDIYGLNISGSESPVFRYLAGTSGDDDFPTWSPDGGLIAYTSRTDDDTNLMIANVESGETWESPLDINSYMNLWLPDGRLAFVSQDEDGAYLYVTDASMIGDWTIIERVPLPFDVVQFDWWIDPAALPTPETP